MANAFTVNLVLTKPEVGADSNLWGGHLNGDMDILDGIFTSASTTFVSIVQKDDSKYVNATNTSKRFILSASLVSTSTTRTLSVPDATGTIALQSYVDAAMPAGAVIPWAGVSTTAPTGWLLCSGQAVSRTTFLTLFNAVNTVYGAGDGTTTFNVPDLRGRVVAGLGNMGGSESGRLNSVITSVTGSTGGAQNNTATTSISGTAFTNGLGGTAFTNGLPTSGTIDSFSGSAVVPGSFGAAGLGDHVSGGVIANASIQVAGNASVSGSGVSSAFVIVQPTIVVNYIIKT